MNPPERLAERIVVDTATGCWNWTGAVNWKRGGYGTVTLTGRKTTSAHRLTYELVVGEIPTGLDLDHLCRNRLCVNPKHLEPVTRRENLLRGQGATAINAAKTHCPQGHEYSPENTYVHPGTNNRRCRTCNAESVHRMRARRAAL